VRRDDRARERSVRAHRRGGALRNRARDRRRARVRQQGDLTVTKEIALRIISAVSGLALVICGIYLLVSGGEHTESGVGLIAGGLGTMGLPAALPGKAEQKAGGE